MRIIAALFVAASVEIIIARPTEVCSTWLLNASPSPKPLQKRHSLDDLGGKLHVAISNLIYITVNSQVFGNTAGVLGRAHTVAAVDQTKLQAAVDMQAAAEAAPGEHSAWQKRRPGATFFEKLQVRLSRLSDLLHLGTP